MKSFNLQNFSKLNLELEIAGKTYSQNDFELSELTSVTRAASTADVVLKGTHEDFVRIRAGGLVVVNIVTETETIPLLEMYAKDPVAFDGHKISVRLDTIPQSKYVSRNSADGTGLPYSFGKPWVAMPHIQSEVSGVITENQFALSKENVLGLIDMYAIAQPTIAALARGGVTAGSLISINPDVYKVYDRQSLFQGHDINLKMLARFHAEIERLKEIAPHKAALLDELALLPYWEGTGISASTSTLGPWFNPPEYPVHWDNLGMPAPISSYALLEADNVNDTLAEDYAYVMRYNNVVETDEVRAAMDAMLIYKNTRFTTASAVPISKSNAKLKDLYTYYRTLCNELLAAPNDISIDLGDADIPEVAIEVGGISVTGAYSNRVLSVASRGPEVVAWSLTASSNSSLASVDVAGADITGRDLVGKYVLVTSNIKYFRTQLEPFSFYYNNVPYKADWTPAEHLAVGAPGNKGALRVIAQDGNTLILAGLPLQAVNEVVDTEYNTPEDAYWEFPLSHLQLGLVRTGTITAVSSTLEGCLYQGNPLLALGAYDWRAGDQEGEWDGGVIVGDTETFGLTDPDDMIEMPTGFAGGWRKSYERGYINPLASIGLQQGYFYYAGYKYVASSNTASFSKSLRTNRRGSPETDTQKLIAHAFSYEEAEYVWELKAGEKVTVVGSVDSFYIVDSRPNITVLGVRAQVDEAYLDVPSSRYVVIPAFEYEGQLVTAIRTYGDLGLVGLSNTLIVQVDTEQATVGSMLAPLAAVLGKSYVEAVAFPIDAVPAYTAFGPTNVLDIVDLITDQSRGAYILSTAELKAKFQAAAPVGVPYALGIHNIESFSLHTSDSLDLLSHTIFSWENFRGVDNSATVVLRDPPPALVHNSTVQIDIYQDTALSLQLAKWIVHRDGRSWLEVELVGFHTELHLEALDAISLELEGVTYLGEIISTQFASDSLEVQVVARLETDGHTLWDVSGDVLC